MLRLPPGSRAEGSKILVYKTAHDGALPLCHIAEGGGELRCWLTPSATGSGCSGMMAWVQECSSASSEFRFIFIL